MESFESGEKLKLERNREWTWQEADGETIHGKEDLASEAAGVRPCVAASRRFLAKKFEISKSYACILC